MNFDTRDGSICDHIVPLGKQSTSLSCEVGVGAQDTEGDRCVCVCVVTSQVPQTKLFSHYQQFSHSLFMIPALSSSTSDCFLLFSALPNRHSFTSILLCAVRPFYPFSKISFDLPLLHLVLNLSFAPLTLSLLFLSPVILLLSHNGSSVLGGKGR